MSTGRSVLDKLEFLDKTQWSSIEDIQLLQFEKIQRLLETAYKCNPFYRKRFDSVKFNPKSFREIEQITQIPVLSKNDLRSNYQNGLITRSKDAQKGFDGATGGSTGVPTQFSISKTSAEYRTARSLRYQKWNGYLLGERRGYIWGVPKVRTQVNRAYNFLVNTLMNSVWLNAWKLNERDMLTFFEIINRQQLKLLEGYANAVYLFARFLIDNDLQLEYPLQTVLSAEKCSIDDRRTITKVFGIEPIDRYGTREFGAIAQECPRRKGLHISAESFFLESMKSQEGVEKLLVTSLDNLYMPFIRYEIGDTSQFTDRSCKCGRGLPLIDEITGRITDFIKTSEGSATSGTLFVHNLRHYDYIEDYQLIQWTLNEIELKLVVSKEMPYIDEKRIKESIMQYLPKSMKIDLSFVEYIERPESGKRMFVISHVIR
jgi:phenylacetate-CoA ligase